MVVAVSAVRVVEVAVDEVVDVVAVRDGGVSTARGVSVTRRVPGTCVRRCARRGVVAGDLDDALVHVAVMAVVEMAVVQVVDVVAVADGGVTAAGAVNVIVSVVGRVAHDFFFPLVVAGAASGSLA